MTVRSDPPRTPIIVLTALGAVAALILAAAAVALAVTWPPAHRGSDPISLRYYAYDLATNSIGSTPRSTFSTGEIPAAAVDPLASDRSGALRATWYDAFGYRTAQAGRTGLADLAAHPVPVSTTSAVPPGDYQFVLEELDAGRVVAVLAWGHVEIRL
ncbi:hypothetical protein [Hamadaea tsunoensis]|uniref:hypothetical protein n=1 Tax=Hamadaea tsunoensis TaxID=53368 RepID=UPI000427B0A3|nr:hypothetical protein [Hamadaea tsunoensis]